MKIFIKKLKKQKECLLLRIKNYIADSNTGYLTIFREINNGEKKKGVNLHFIKNKTIELVNLLTRERINTRVDGDGIIDFEIENPADFRFYKWRIKNEKSNVGEYYGD